MSKIIEVIVSSKGETTLKTIGFNGQECRQASAPLESALGLKTHEKLTGEFYATNPQAQTTRQ